MIILGVEPVVGEEARYRWESMVGIKHTLSPQVITSAGLVDEEATGFGTLSSSVGEKTIIPTSTDFGIVIEKINANAKVIFGVDPGNEAEYTQALSQGVAAARGSTLPGEVGNLYIFSHSADAPWNTVRFNAVFYLLRELVPGDRVVIFYKSRRYDYVVYDKAIVKPEDVTYLTNRYDQPVLTLQTCDPPGTLLNRLIVRARLAGFRPS